MTEVNKIVEFYRVPEKFVGIVIGKKGSEIRQIQQNAGCRVQMEQDNTSTDGFRNCILEGSAAQVAMARQLITSIINRSTFLLGDKPVQPAVNDVTEDYPIPTDKCGMVIGKGGETIRTVKEQSGLKSCSVVKATGKMRPLRMFGTPAAIETAKQLVNNIMNNNHSPARSNALYDGQGHGDGPQSVEKGGVIVPGLAAGVIIGKGGKMIKRLAQETGAKILFKTAENSEDCVAIITGTHEQIYRATMCITELVNRAIKYKGGVTPIRIQSIYWMHVPANKAGLVFGKGGKNIKQIERETGAYCGLAAASEQTNDDEKVFEIRGTLQQIQLASHLIRVKAIAPFRQPIQQQSFQPFQWNRAFQQQASILQTRQPPGFTWSYQDVSHLQNQELYQQPGTPQNEQTVSSAASASPDYSAQLAASYRSMGLAEVETQMRRNQAWFSPFQYLCYPPPVQKF